MKKLKMSYQAALKQVKLTRSIVNLNPGFIKQLEEWDRQLHTTISVPESNGPKPPINVITPVDVIDFVEASDRSK